MRGSSREPWDLAQQMSRRLQRANVAQRGEADALLAWASWNLTTAQLGWDVLQRARPDGDENFTGHTMHIVEMAAMNLVFRGVVSAMDQLAGAVFRLTGQSPPANRERSVAWWFGRGNRPWAKVPAPVARWLREFDGNATWQLATELRHGFTHRTVPRHVCQNEEVGSSLTPSHTGLRPLPVQPCPLAMTGDRVQLQEYLREQVGFLRKNGAAFDEGDTTEAKQIATSIRLLVHDTGRSRSLLRQMRVKDRLQFVDSSSPPPPPGAIVVISGGLAVMHTDFDLNETRFAAPLEDRGRRKPLAFNEWWSRPVLIDSEGNRFNRRDLVLGLAHKEGGAHVDLDMDRAYERLARSNSLGLQFGKQDEWVAAESPVPSNVRQIGWELQTTIEEQLDELLDGS